MNIPQTYVEVLDFLYAQLPMFQRVGPAAFKKDLTNISRFSELMGHPHRSFPTIHIAGTNGKGSTAHILSNLIAHNGQRVGIYTSPHFKDYRERIKIGADYIPEEDVISFVHEFFEDIQEIRPSFFEITVAMAFWYFRKENVDIAVIETGLGGRLDSTNIIKPVISIITNIGFDHMEFLGDTLQEIALEKAGIMKQDVPCLIGERQRETELVFEKKSKSVRCPLYYADTIIELDLLDTSVAGNSYVWKSQDGSGEFTTDLRTLVQKRNLRTALAAYHLLTQRNSSFAWGEDHIRASLGAVTSELKFQGRFQILQRDPLVIVDGAHNTEGLQLLLDEVDRIPHKKLIIILGMVKDKDLQRVFELLPQKARYIATQADIPRALAARQLNDMLISYGLESESISSPHMALKKAVSLCQDDDLILVTGSMYLVAEVI